MGIMTWRVQCWVRSLMPLLPQLPVVESFLLSTLVKEDFCCSGQQLMKKLITGLSTESKWLWVPSHRLGDICVNLPPTAHSQAHHIKQGKKDVRAGRREECCVILSSRHDMAVRHKLKPNLNPCMNKERGSEARFLGEDTLRAEGYWARESHFSIQIQSAVSITGTNEWPHTHAHMDRTNWTQWATVFKNMEWKGEKPESGLSELWGEGSRADQGIMLSKTKHKYYLSKEKKSKESTNVLLLVPKFLSQALFRITFVLINVQDFCWTQEKETMLILSSWKHILQSWLFSHVNSLLQK